MQIDEMDSDQKLAYTFAMATALSLQMPDQAWLLKAGDLFSGVTLSSDEQHLAAKIVLAFAIGYRLGSTEKTPDLGAMAFVKDFLTCEQQ